MFCYARYHVGTADYEYDKMNLNNMDTLRRILNSDCYDYYLGSACGAVLKKVLLQKKDLFP